MRNLEVALCDLDSDYILRFASHLMEIPNVSVHIFTTTEGFFMDESDYDVTILTDEFQDIVDFRSKGRAGHKYLLTEDTKDQEDYIYKYQAVDKIINEIHELRKIGIDRAFQENNKGKSKLVGIYSPANHELSLPFSMAVSQNYRAEGRVLFLDLEEVSILTRLMGNICERNLMDLLYEVSTEEKPDISKYITSFMGFDYVSPFENPNEISEIEEVTWEKFFGILEGSNYDAIVILFGRTINGFSRFIGRLSKLYLLGRPGDYFKMSQDFFLDYMRRINAEDLVESVMLPMSAGNLSDGTYQIEELLQGNLGVFVKRLVSANSKRVMENYG